MTEGGARGGGESETWGECVDAASCGDGEEKERPCGSLLAVVGSESTENILSSNGTTTKVRYHRRLNILSA